MAPPSRGKPGGGIGSNGTSTSGGQMQRSSSTNSGSHNGNGKPAAPLTGKCSCGHPHSTGSLSGASSAAPPKPMTASTALKRQRELRDFALIDRLLARVFWLRFYEDAARLYSTRLTLIAKERLPFLIQNIVASGGGPGWACANAGSEEVREYFRMQIQVDLRELEDRLWHISSEWTYTAIRKMAISNGFNVSPSGLRVVDLIGLIPLLEAMCDGLENAPKSVYEIHPHRAIAATFLNLNFGAPLSLATAKKNGLATHTLPTLPPQSICAHHPANKCALDGSTAPIWGPSLYRITSSAFGKPGSGNKLKDASAYPSANSLFDALFPPALNSLKPPATGKRGASPSAAACQNGFTDTEMLHAQAELRSILALGLSRLFIVLFQTAQEFNLRSFGEHVNLAFGGSGSTGPVEESDGEFYGGCECCLEDYYQSQYGSEKDASIAPPPPLPPTGMAAYDEALYDLWKSISKTPAVSAPPVKRKSAKRARNNTSSSTGAEPSASGPYANAKYRGLYSPRPGAGLKAWDTVLHYEAVIREEEEEKTRKEDEKRLEREKYGLKGSGTAPARPVANGAGHEHAHIPLDGQPCRRAGKGREGSESDGRGGGLLGWNSCHEEDVWERDLDTGDDFGIEDYFGFINKDKDEEMASACRCRRVALRYLLAEEYKEDGNAAFKAGDYEYAIECYTKAHKSEPRLPIYLLNRSMASLKLSRWNDAELDCSAVLRKHRTNAKALWRRAKARRATAQLTGNVEKLIEAERDLIDFLALLPNSLEGNVELASIRAELCPCFECSEQSDTALFCSTSSTAPPTSCFNRGYRPSPYLNASEASNKALEESILRKSADILGAPPKGWLATPPGSGPVNAKPSGTKSKAVNSTAASFNVPWFKTTPTGSDRGIWQAFIQDFSLLPESVSTYEDRMPLKFVSDHDLPSSILPNWDLYRVARTK